MKNSKIIKKIAAAALGLAMIFSFAACGQSSAQPAETKKPETEQSTAAPAPEKTETPNTADSEKTEYKVGIVKFMDHASLDQIEENIQKQLDVLSAELNVTFDYADYTYNGQGDSSTLNQIAAQLIDDGVDVVVPIATPAAQVMQSAVVDEGIPMVFAAVSDPVTAKLVESMEVPGGSITGVSDALNTAKIMDMITAVNPDIKTVGLLYSKSEDSSTKSIQEAKDYLDSHGIAYVEKTGTNTDEVISAVDGLISSGVEAIFTPTDNTIMTAELAIFEKLQDAGIPHYAGADSFALNGAFLGYGVDYGELGQEVANMVADILVKGADPASTPILILTHESATVNTETCEAIGLTIEQVEQSLAPLGLSVEQITTAKSFS